MAAGSTGNCYLCGANLGKTAMKNHLLKVHAEDEDGQECCLLKVEVEFDKDYWLFIDVPVEKTLSAVDKFLRKIWLECCGHMSQFCRRPWDDIIGMQRKVGDLPVEQKFFYQYDFGDTSELLISIIGTTKRKKQKEVVRLLARNAPPVFKCADCEKPGEFICMDMNYERQFYCADCAEGHKDDDFGVLPITNSPRMGLCAYDGELDTFTFNPEAFAKA